MVVGFGRVHRAPCFYVIFFVFTILLHRLENNLNGHDPGLGGTLNTYTHKHLFLLLTTKLTGHRKVSMLHK